MSINRILLLVVFFFHLHISEALPNVPKSDLSKYKQEIADDVVSQFKQLLEYNKQNDLRGESHKNKYVLRYEQGSTFNMTTGGIDYIQQHTFNNTDWMFPWPDNNNNNEFDLEEELCAFNTNVTQTNIFDIRKYAIIFGLPTNHWNTALSQDITSQPAIVTYMQGTNADSNKSLFFGVEALIENKIRNDLNTSFIDVGQEKIITISSYYRYKTPYTNKTHQDTRTRTFYLQSSNLTEILFNAYLNECNSIDDAYSKEKYTGRFYQRIRGFLNFFGSPVNFDQPFDACLNGFTHPTPNEVRVCYCDNATTLPQQQFLTEIGDFLDDNHYSIVGVGQTEIEWGFDCDDPHANWISTVFDEFKMYETANPGTDGSQWVLQEKIMALPIADVASESLMFWFAKASLAEFQQLSKDERSRLIELCMVKYPNGTSALLLNGDQTITITKKLYEVISTAVYLDVPQAAGFLTNLKDKTGLMKWLWEEVVNIPFIDLNSEYDEHSVVQAITAVATYVNGGQPGITAQLMTDWENKGVIWKPTPWWWSFAGHYEYDNLAVEPSGKVKFTQRFITSSNILFYYFIDNDWEFDNPFEIVPVGGGKDVTWATDCSNGDTSVVGCGKLVWLPAFSVIWYMDKLNNGQTIDALITAIEVVSIAVGGAQFSALVRVASSAGNIARARMALYGFSLAAQITDLTLPGVSGFVAQNLLDISGARANEIKVQIKKVTGILAAIGGVLEITDLFVGLAKYQRVSKALAGAEEANVKSILDDVTNMLIEFPEYTGKLCHRMGITNSDAVSKVVALNVVDQRIAVMGMINQTPEIRALVNGNENLVDFFVTSLNIGVDPSIHKLLLSLDDAQYLKLLQDLDAGDMITAFNNNLDLLNGWKQVINAPDEIRRNVKYVQSASIDFSTVGYTVDDLIAHGTHPTTVIAENVLQSNTTVNNILEALVASQQLTHVEASALFRYTYYNPTSGIGGSGLVNPVFLPANQASARLLDDALRKFGEAGNAIPNGTVTTRGGCYDAARMAEFETAFNSGNPLDLPVVLSSSLDNTGSVAHAFIDQTYQAGVNTRTIITITTKEGVNVDAIAHWGSNFDAVSNPGITAAPNLPHPQLEVLQRANRQYNVTNIIDDFNSPEYPGELLKRITMTEL